MNFDPAFDQTKRPKPDHECVWAQTRAPHIEACTVPGCIEARVSRMWIEAMLAPIQVFDPPPLPPGAHEWAP